MRARPQSAKCATLGEGVHIASTITLDETSLRTLDNEGILVREQRTRIGFAPWSWGEHLRIVSTLA